MVMVVTPRTGEDTVRHTIIGVTTNATISCSGSVRQPGLVGASLLGTVVKLNIGPVHFVPGHVINLFFGTTP